jgi:hypothetical protein
MARFGLPAITSQIGSDLRQFLDRVREFIESSTRGDTALITRSTLIDSGIAVVGPGNSLLPGASSGGAPEFSTVPPPAPAGLFASGTLTSIYLTWNEPGYSNHSYSKVFRSVDDNFSNAVLIGSSSTRIFTDSTGMGADYYYWIQHVSKADITGPVVGSGVGSSGVHAFTSADNTPMLNLLENAITAAHVQAESITGDRLTGQVLVALTALLGEVSAGNLTIDAAGYLRGGQTDFNTGNGFWLGYKNGKYVLSLNNVASDSFTFDDNGLKITGNLTINSVAESQLVANADFTSGLTDWNVVMASQTNGSWSAETYNGSQQAKFTGTAAGATGEIECKKFPVVAGESFSFSMQVTAPTNDATVYIGLYYATDPAFASDYLYGGAGVTYVLLLEQFVPTLIDPQNFYVSGVIPINAVWASVSIQLAENIP